MLLFQSVKYQFETWTWGEYPNATILRVCLKQQLRRLIFSSLVLFRYARALDKKFALLNRLWKTGSNGIYSLLI